METLYETPRKRKPGSPPMHVVDGGPQIPGPVLDAQEEGRLVFLCGAGISVPNGLPLFKGLVQEVWQHSEGAVDEGDVDIEEVLRTAEDAGVSEALDLLGSEKFSDVLAAILDGSYDRALSCIEHHYGKVAVRKDLQDRLAVPPDPFTRTHEALLDLATTNAGDVQLVTTNFDLLFEAASQNVRCCSAPTLLVPKRGKWNALVYLHGRIDEDDPEGRHLVLNSADFGTAYLSERWASRFVSELFRNFTVVFVGYSAKDPVMRYLLDALAADRQLSEALAHETFALVPHPPDTSRDVIKTEWKGKNITPIPYKVRDSADCGEDHSLLHDTLHQWAQLWSRGIKTRKNLAYDLGRKDPGGLSDEAQSRFLWALSSPHVARHVADLGVEVDLGWIDILKAKGWLENVVAKHRRVVSLIGYASRNPPPLDKVSRQLAHWMAAHIGNPELARRIIKHGPHLHPELIERIDPTDAGDPALEKIWQVLCTPDILFSPHDFQVQNLSKLPSDNAWTPWLRQAFLRAMTPVLRLSENIFLDFREYSEREEDQEKAGDEAAAGEEIPLQVSDIAVVECEVQSDRAHALVEFLRRRSDSDEILSGIAMDVTVLLRQALELFASLDQASADHDPSGIQQPSISPHEQNNHFHGWTWLIELCRDAFDALLHTDHDRAMHLLDEWVTISFPVFRRLSLYAMKKMTEQNQ